MTRTAEEARVAPEVLARYEAVIGLEVHVQLKTVTKVFCSCRATFGDPPNTNVCPVCLGLPGALPVLNKGAVEKAIRAALALHCTIHESSRFARKNYFYPDLPKGYQISMYELPLATGGWLEIAHDGATKRIGITRLHMEDDAAKALHEGFPDSAEKTYIDFNRCGVPLAEIVSEPDMRAPAEAYAYLTALKQTLEYAEVSDCDMEKGSLRCDANVSVRPRGQEKFGVKAEVKNLNSFRYVQRALEHEIERQITLLESGGRVAQETRLWNVAEGRTEPMRSKEFAHDYRYFPEPDLLPLRVSEAWKAEIAAAMPELPDAKRARLQSMHGLSAYDAGVLTATRVLADYFEATVKAGAPAKSAANWIQTELLRRLNDAGHDITASPIAPAALSDLIKRVESQEITAAIGKKVFAAMFDTGKSAAEIISAEGLGGKVSDAEIEQAARDVIAKNPDNVAKFRSGNEGVFKFFVGQVMKATRGQADPQTVNAIIEVLLRPLRPPGQLSRVRYQDLVYHLQRIQEWLPTIGIVGLKGRFHTYQRNIQMLLEAMRQGAVESFLKDEGFVSVIWSLVDSLQLVDVFEMLRDQNKSILRSKLSRALTGPIVPLDEDMNSNEARNVMFELGLAASLSSVGYKLVLGDSPDLTIESQGSTIAIECKRILSARGIEGQVKDAAKTVEAYSTASADCFGLVAIDVTRTKNVGHMLFETASAATVGKDLGEVLDTILRENFSAFKKASRPKVIGVMLCAHTPTFLKRESLLTATRQVAILPLCPVTSPDMAVLRGFASRLNAPS